MRNASFVTALLSVVLSLPGYASAASIQVHDTGVNAFDSLLRQVRKLRSGPFRRNPRQPRNPSVATPFDSIAAISPTLRLRRGYHRRLAGLPGRLGSIPTTW